jgi:hypothetical protein
VCSDIKSQPLPVDSGRVFMWNNLSSHTSPLVYETVGAGRPASRRLDPSSMFSVSLVRGFASCQNQTGQLRFSAKRSKISRLVLVWMAALTAPSNIMGIVTIPSYGNRLQLQHYINTYSYYFFYEIGGLYGIDFLPKYNGALVRSFGVSHPTSNYISTNPRKLPFFISTPRKMSITTMSSGVKSCVLSFFRR